MSARESMLHTALTYNSYRLSVIPFRKSKKPALREGDAEALAAVQEAERIFAERRARGALAFRVWPGRPAERLDHFDPHAEQVVIVPRVAGG